MRSIIIPSIVLPILIIALIGWYKNRSLPFFSKNESATPSATPWKYVLALCCVIAYSGLFLIISAAWLQGDDWWLLGIDTIEEHISEVFHTYLDWVSRVGEVLIRATGITYNRWEPRILNSLVLTLAPLALFRLCKRGDQSIFSAGGVAFYVFALGITLLNMHLPLWKNVYDYANCANYVYPSVATALLLSFYRTDALKKQSSHMLCIALFLLGLICGWGTEAGSAVLLPLMTLLLVSAKIGKTQRWTPHAYAGYFGALVGGAFLFLSPALIRRTARTIASMPLDVSSLTALQKQEFLQNLSPTSVLQIRGESNVLLIKDFDLLDRFWYFSSYWAERFLSCCWIGLTAVIVLVLLMLVTTRPQKKSLRPIAGGMLIAGTGVAMAASYLTTCIPSMMAFYPACFCITIAACFLYLRLQKYPKLACSAAVLGISLYLFVPAGYEAWQYKHYEHERWANIQAQIAEGKRDVILPPPYPTEPKDPFKLIKAHQLGEDPTFFPNNMAKRSLNIDSIRQAQPKPCTRR